jgi:hypothetical protein
MRRSLLLFAVLCGLAVVFATSHLGTSGASAATSSGPVFGTSNPITFDFIKVGETSETLVDTITNSGTAALVFKGVTLAGRDARDFGLATNTCAGATLQPGETCKVGVSFTPTAAGTRVAFIHFVDNSPCDDWVTIAGSGSTTTPPVTASAATCSQNVTQALSSVSGASTVVTFATCSSRRTITVGFAPPKGKTFKKVVILLRGKAVQTLTGDKIKTDISLRGLPRGRFTVEVKATTTDGKSYDRKHFYVTCVSDK